jgi:hypothetical protein
MKTVMVIIIVSLILLPTARACPRTDCGLDAGRIISKPLAIVPGAASLIVNGVKCTVRTVTSFGADVPRHASHTPRMAVNASSKGVVSAKAKASEGMMGFSTLSSFLLRIASSSFWALVSGILRF